MVKGRFTFVQGWYSTISTNGLAGITAIEDILTLEVGVMDLGKSAADRTGQKMPLALYYDASYVLTRSETILVTQP